MTEDYEVGYGKPPKATQFKPGQSGNPHGRPPGSKNLETELAEELQERILIKEAGQGKTVSKQRAMIKSLTARAIQGDARAMSLILNMMSRLFHNNEAAPDAVDMSATDHAILKAYKARLFKTMQAREEDHEPE